MEQQLEPPNVRLRAHEHQEHLPAVPALVRDGATWKAEDVLEVGCSTSTIIEQPCFDEAVHGPPGVGIELIQRLGRVGEQLSDRHASNGAWGVTLLCWPQHQDEQAGREQAERAEADAKQ